MSEGKEANNDGVTVDENLYSRQLAVYGKEAQKRMAASSILLLGLNGLGVEVAKNIILAGVKSVALWDDTVVSRNDLGSQFYLKPSHVGNVSRSEASFEQLSELNKYVEVTRVEGDPLKVIESKAHQIVVCCGQSLENCLAYNKLTHANGQKFIMGDVRGVLGQVFADLGEEHTVLDPDDNRCQRSLVVGVEVDPENKEQSIVTCDKNEPHNLKDGDWVTFEEMDGITELNGCEPRQVKLLDLHRFSIGDISNLSTFQAGSSGYFNQVKVPSTVSFTSLKASLDAPVFPDNVDDPFCIMAHCVYRAIQPYVYGDQEPKGAYGTLSKEQAQAVVDKAKEYFGALTCEIPKNIWTGKPVEFDEEAQAKALVLARCCRAVINPMCAVFGGLVGQEVLKASSGKFTPVHQFLYFESSPSAATFNEFKVPDDATSSRYDDQVAVVGPSVHTALTALNVFVVGSGAIGCEMLKNFAMMGVATDGGVDQKSNEGKGVIHLTDMDSIETSNLNRQFLFRESDVDKLKSEAAAAAVTVMNPRVNIDARQLRVGNATENIYDSKFWRSLDLVVTALDNRMARKYVDLQCVKYDRLFIDSATLGTRGNTQVFIPGKTETYSTGTKDPPEEDIPACTLKFFPNKIEHTIHYVRDKFEGLFKQQALETKKYLADPEAYLKEAREDRNSFLQNLEIIKDNLITSAPSNFEDCVHWARVLFEKYYNHAMRQLLFVHPADKKTPSGTPFWSGPKRCPKVLEFDPQDETHLGFVLAAANLRAFNFGIPSNRDESAVISFAKTAQVPKFVADTSQKIAANDEELKAQQEAKKDEEEFDPEAWEKECDALIAELDAAKSSFPKADAVTEADFEKDDDSNFHMDFITAASNLRARNYDIKEESKLKTKLIAGKIIPAIATTTALVTGLVTLEMYKFQLKRERDDFRSFFANTSICLLTGSSPGSPFYDRLRFVDAETKEERSYKWCIWDKIHIPKTKIKLKGIVKEALKDYPGINDVLTVTYGDTVIYASAYGQKKKNWDLPLRRAIEKSTDEKLDDSITEVDLNVLVRVGPDPKERDENKKGQDQKVGLPVLRVQLPKRRNRKK